MGLNASNALIERMVSSLRSLDFRGKIKLLNPWVPRGGARTVRLFGSRVTLDLADELQRLVYMGAFELPETRWVKGWLKPGQTFVDAGANIGYYTLLAARLVGPRGRVVAIEPELSAFEQLARTLSENDLPQVVALPVGLSRADGTASLHIPPLPQGGGATMIEHDESSVTVAVPVRALDSLMSEHAIDQIDLLKIDVEGYEGLVLEGAQKAMRDGRIKSVLCEFNDKALRAAGLGSEILRDRFIRLGFRDTNPRPLRTDTWLENRMLVYRG